MGASRFCGGASARLGRIAAVFCLTTAFTQGARAAETPAPHLPDMSAYSCAGLSPATVAGTRHIGQVIKGTYAEWTESFKLINGERQLACISMMRPTVQDLSATDAKAFLLDSFAIGVPAAGRSHAPSDAAVAEPDPANVRPEPMKRLSKPPASAPDMGGQSAPTPELPPRPASKIFGAHDPRATSQAAPLQLSSTSSTAATSTTATETPLTAGVDDRAPVTNTQAFPWDTLGYLVVTYGDGSSWRCTSTIVSPYVALTAGHCIHNQNRGGYVISARVYPGQNQINGASTTRPYGSNASVAALETSTEWTQISGNDSYPITDYKWDFAAIEFSTPFTYTNTFMPVIYGSTGTPVTSAGYPAQVGSATVYGLYSENGAETSRTYGSHTTTHIREFAVDATGGNSGGPFIYTDPSTGQHYVVGSLSYGEDLDDAAGGPWYDSWNQPLLSGWVSWAPTMTETVQSVGGVRLASVFSSAQANLLSYLRFYNSGTASGTVAVTLADYTTGTALATWTSPSLPAGSSRQFSIADIESGADRPFTKSMVYSLSVRPTFIGTVQNVLWNKIDSSLTDITTCDTPGNSKTTLTNVHTSLMDDSYPAAVVVHSTATTNISVNLAIYDAQSGQRLGNYTTPTIPPNGQILLSMPSIEAGARISPNGAYHYNIRSESGGSEATFSGYLQMLLNNKSAGSVTDMTATCVLSP